MDFIKTLIKAPLLWGGVGVGLLLAFSLQLSAQSFSFSDLFGQAAKQKQNYLKQLAAYRAFESELKQGYAVITKGLGSIQNITGGELGQHSAYYSSLSQVVSAIKDNSQVKDIKNWQSAIINVFSTNFPNLTSGEQQYVQQVKTGILTACDRDITDLENLLHAGVWQMTDDERLRRLATIHTAMLDKYRFTQDFTYKVLLLAAQRLHESNNTQIIDKLYGID